jgi:hypothetical protein
MKSWSWLETLRALALLHEWTEQRATSIDVELERNGDRVRLVIAEGGSWGGAWRTIEGAERATFTTSPELVQAWLREGAQLSLFG